MNCEKMFEIMPELLNKTLGKDEEKAALLHLMECEECRQELAFWTKVADAQKDYAQEFKNEQKQAILENLMQEEMTAISLTTQAVKVYFKVIESILNI